MYPHCNHKLRGAPPPQGGEGWGEGAPLLGVLCGRIFACDLRSSPLTPALSPLGRGGRFEFVGSVETIDFISAEQNFAADGFEYAVEIFDDFMVPEAKYAVAEGFDGCGAGGVGGNAVVGAMLSAIEFDNEFEAAGAEIGDVIADWFLPHEFNAFHLSAAQARPEFALDIGGVAAQASGGACQFAYCHISNPLTPALSPQGRGGLTQISSENHAQTH
jgi:hypothetical protein